MSGRRATGKTRRKNELYETPAWVVVDGLAPFFRVSGQVIGEHACGRGKLAGGLRQAGALLVMADKVFRKDAAPAGTGFHKVDFLSPKGKEFWLNANVDALVTNPPWGLQGELAVAFIERGLELLRNPKSGTRWMALLLGIDYDLAGSRIHLFERCAEYHGTVRLRRRIEWFKRKTDPKTGKLSAGPSQHHAWYIWTAEPRKHGELPVVHYAPQSGVIL